MVNKDYVILVDTDDNPIGLEEKLTAHQLGHLHRAFSVCILSQHDSNWQILLQQRAYGKYHSGGLWTNTCCSHPREHETIVQAAERRLKEEMGVVAPLQVIGRFIYQARLDNNLIEHELDHVLMGTLNHAEVQPDPAEVIAYSWEPLLTLRDKIAAQPERYTAWLDEVIRMTLAQITRE